MNPLMARRQLCDHVSAKGIQARMLYNGSGRAIVSQRARASARSHTPAFNFKSCSPLG